LISKSYVFSRYYQATDGHPSPVWWIEGVFGIQTSTNPGALFGFGAGYHQVFAAISAVFLVLILGWVIWGNVLRDRWLAAALGLIVAGICGNLYDRLGWGFGFGMPESLRYHVRDWILFRWEGLPGFDPWPNFNIADACLVVGAISIFLHGLWQPDSRQANPHPVENSGEDNR
jgi:signal peptidase II